MRIKRLELKGFKSFADKTQIEMAPGITAVVGPNGSGKSNLADALKWVLGEQSAKALRGGRMDDLIFAGTKTRRGVGLAEVTLVFDNDEGMFPLPYNEVAVTRRIYKSGEAEYYLNRSICRLKDIQELFMDTGVGKDAYSFIGQGRIDEILSAKPEERRIIFEEVAGVAKYKARKRDSELKLRDVEVALTRINDLLYELGQQLAPLREEAASAKEYLSIEAERRSWERELLLYELHMLERRQLSTNKQREELSDKVIEIDKRLLSIEAAEEQLRLGLAQKQESIDLLNYERSQLLQQMERLAGEERLLASNRAANEEEMSRLQARKAEIETRLGRLQEQASQVVAQTVSNAGELKELAEISSRLDAQLSQLTADTMEEELRQAEEALDVVVRQRSQLELAVSLWQDRLKRLQEEQGTLVEQDEQLSSDQAAAGQELTLLQERLTELRASLLQFREQSDLQRGKQENLLQKREAKAKEHQQSQAELAATKSRLGLLGEMAENLEGYQRGVRAVMEAMRRGQAGVRGIIGAVGELLQVPPELETAIEVALGGALQNIVTETEEDARRAIEFLKQQKAGRATFLPLSVIQRRNLRPVELEAAKMSGALGFAAELTEYDPRLSNIVSSLLGNILVVGTLDEALQIARQCKHQVRMVTLEGDLLYPGGSLSGGSRTQRGSGLLGRQREITELKQKLKQLTLRRDQLADGLEQLDRDLSAGREKLLELDKLQMALTEEGQDLAAKERSLAAVIETRARQMAENQAACQRLAARYVELQDELSEAAAKLAAQLEEEETLSTRLQSLEGLSRGQAVERSELLEQRQQVAVAMAQLKEKQDSLQREQQVLQERRSEEMSNAESLERQLIELGKRQATLAEKLANLKTERQALADAASTKDDELKQGRVALEGYQAKLEENRKAARQGRDERDTQKGLLYNAELRHSRLETEHAALLARLKTEYDITDRTGLHSTLSSRSEGENALAVLKEKMLALGPVRVGALQELERLEGRLAFLEEQRRDLESSRMSLQEVIAEIDQVMAKRFVASFEQVERAFQQMFKELFGGGEASLTLADAKNPLESGIEIKVQPPGKNLQSINLLSGGEKALAAIALLCSVLHIKPTPFCILDEIDAALDDANIRRFVQVLSRLAKETQFIIITHSKETMLAADTLYGITMVEQGVSQPISVRLSEVPQQSQVSDL